MQFKTIITSGLVLLASHLFAQNNLPVSATAQKQLTQRAPEVLAMLNRLYRYAEQPSGSAARGGAPQLDSTVLYTGYPLGMDTFPLEKVEFSYPSDHVIVTTEYAYFDQWHPDAKITQIRDNLDRLVEIQGERYDSDAMIWVPDSRIYVTPHGNSLEAVDSMIVEAWDYDAGVWVTTLQTNTSFDNQDRPVATLSYLNFGGFEIALLDELYYDANGDNHLIEQSVYEAGIWTMYNTIEIEYVQHQEVRRTTLAVGDPGMLVPTNLQETTYDANGNTVLVESYEYDFFTSEWVLTEVITRGFDNQNRLTFLQTEDLSTNGPLPNRIDYVYLDGDHIAVEIYSEQEVTTQTWVVLDKTYYYYSGTTSSHEVINGEALRLSPNPTTGFVRLPVSAGARVTVLNIGGASMPVANQANGQIDLSNLPAGIYYITVQEGPERRVGKVVKQ